MTFKNGSEHQRLYLKELSCMTGEQQQAFCSLWKIPFCEDLKENLHQTKRLLQPFIEVKHKDQRNEAPIWKPIKCFLLSNIAL